MSLAGLDIGSGSAKISVYSERGKCIAFAKENYPSRYPGPGLWELDPGDVWEKVYRSICRIARLKSVKDDPVQVLAISASGREIFPADIHGKPLGPCIMAGDARDYGVREAFEMIPDFRVWAETCGHIPERMDPVCRLLWWKKNYPGIVQKAAYFLGWHEYLTLKLCGRPVTDRSLAGKWLIYDIKSHSWSHDHISMFGIKHKLLPEIEPWGTIIGTLDKKLASKAGLSTGIKIAVGGFDACCSALGTGISDPETGCLLSGTWENLIIPVICPCPDPELIEKGIFTGPYPGMTQMAVFALNPNGNSVIDWACRLTGKDIRKTDDESGKHIDRPSEILAIPYLSGSPVPFGNKSCKAGSLIGLSLSTTANEIIKALKESIVFNLQISLSLLAAKGIKVKTLRAAGGGSNSEWWTQLKCDLLRVPVEISDQEETGTAGAAILAGYANGVFSDISEGVNRFTRIMKYYKPDKQRFEKYKQKMVLYRKTVRHLSGIQDGLKEI